MDADLLKLKARPKADPLAKPEIRRDVLRDVEAIERAWKNSGPQRRRKLVAALATAFKLQAGAPPIRCGDR